MKKYSRILICLAFLFVLIAAMPQPAQAATVPCDARLFLAGQITAFHDPTPPVINQQHMAWSYTDTPYRVNYGWSIGIAGYVRSVIIWQGRQVVGTATNGVWSVCHRSQAWRNYLIQHLPSGI